MLPAVIDLEASGFGRGSWPIEVGWVLGDGRRGCTLVAPPPHWTHWSEEAEHKHGIRRDIAELYGRSVDVVAAWLNAELAGCTLYTDAWGFDVPWLDRLFDEAGCVPYFRLESLRTLLDEDEALHWQPTYRAVIAECAVERHRASSDAWLIQCTLCRLKGWRQPVCAGPLERPLG